MYKLDLPDSIKITKIRYVSVLEPADPEVLLIKDMLDIDPKSQKKVWEIKKILDIDLMDNN